MELSNNPMIITLRKCQDPKTSKINDTLQMKIVFQTSLLYNKNMNSEIKKVLNKIEKAGFEAYIVGGFVRDSLLNRKSNDIDICTNAKPKDVQNLFPNSKPNGNYGTINLKTSKYNYDITTYRKEKNFNKRNPSTIEYTDNLLEDLKRRDFTINAICMNQKGKIIDPINGIKDIKEKKIKVIGDPKERLKEDPLRILRAVRFSCVLDFQIEETLWEEIKLQKESLNTLSKERIKIELNSILLSKNFQKGLNILEKIGLLQNRNIKIEKLNYVNDVCGMWAQINIDSLDFFTKNERKQINIIKSLLEKEELTSMDLYEYGLYFVMVAAKIKKIPESKITKMYKKLPIESRKDLNITFEEIALILEEEGKNVKKVEEELIQKVIERKIKNKKEILIKEILKEVNQ